MSTLTDLLSIKQHRERQAERALQDRRRALEAAMRACNAAEQTIRDYQHYAKQREAALYSDLYRQPVHVAAIDYVLTSVEAMGTHEAALRAHLETLKHELDSARMRFGEALLAHQSAIRATEKFTELTRLQLEADMRAGERHEELEIEETNTIHGNDSGRPHERNEAAML